VQAMYATCGAVRTLLRSPPLLFNASPSSRKGIGFPLSRFAMCAVSLSGRSDSSTASLSTIGMERGSLRKMRGSGKAKDARQMMGGEVAAKVRRNCGRRQEA
jgi:hypothetical protein